ncbi:hypothetical protein N5V81_13695 [Escherichia coli]|nr:hypothetical protein [Escherichia coli]
MELFDKRTEFFEKLADLVVTDDIAAQLQQEGISMDPNDLKTMIKSFYTRNWPRNGVLKPTSSIWFTTMILVRTTSP